MRHDVILSNIRWSILLCTLLEPKIPIVAIEPRTYKPTSWYYDHSGTPPCNYLHGLHGIPNFMLEDSGLGPTRKLCPAQKREWWNVAHFTMMPFHTDLPGKALIFPQPQMPKTPKFNPNPETDPNPSPTPSTNPNPIPNSPSGNTRSSGSFFFEAHRVSQ